MLPAVHDDLVVVRQIVRGANQRFGMVVVQQLDMGPGLCLGAAQRLVQHIPPVARGNDDRDLVAQGALVSFRRADGRGWSIAITDAGRNIAVAT